MAQSVESQISELGNSWLKEYGLPYKLQNASLNSAIDDALANYESKTGGKGGNRPDTKLILRDKNLDNYPILIEYKGYKNKLEKLDQDGNVVLKNSKNEPDYKTINAYAVNGAVHYANAILQYTDYTGVIAIGMTGYEDDFGKLQWELGVYFVSKDNLGAGQKVDNYTDLSFLKKDNFDKFIEKIKRLSLTPEELEKLREKREQQITASLVKLNNDIFQTEKGLSESDRIYIVFASIIATLGIPNRVKVLESSDLKSSIEKNNRDGDIILRKVASFLSEKEIPSEKADFIIRTLQNTLSSERLNRPEMDKEESQLKRVFNKIVDDLGIYYKTGITTDFTGKLFNEMYNWLGFSQDQLNDVVLTPSYIAKLLVKLARVNKDSYVWDFAAGSAGLLVAAMNEMLDDAKEKIKSPEQLEKKFQHIKFQQLLGIEILPAIYMLAVLNMILMGDGSSNILNENSLTNFDGNNQAGVPFPADAFVLNPPYSAEGHGMVFVQKALSMMKKGYAAVIIQNSAGSGKAIDYNKEILKSNTLLASIKMPADLFMGKSSVLTYIYVFRVGEPHQKDDIVRFIDFSNDGYKRASRKKAKRSDVNLRDIDHAKERYQEVVDLVRYGKSKLHYLREDEFFEGTIDPKNGADWNQSVPVDPVPKLEDFKKTVGDYLIWEISTIIKNQEDESLGK